MSMDETFQIGQYVRHATKDQGTGKIVGINYLISINEKTNKVDHSTVYAVRWLDLTVVNSMLNPIESLPATSLRASARSVPKFATPEEAEAWLEEQQNPGGWVGKVEDSAASVGDAQGIDAEFEKLMKGMEPPAAEG